MAQNTNLDSKEIPQAKNICVVDGNSLMHRAYHAVPPTMKSPDGTPTNALFGFMSMFLKMVEIFNPDGVICAFDKGRPQVRIDMLPQYKAQRKSMDDELRVQFPLMKKLLSQMDIPVVEKEGWEGDDILGTLARQGSELGYTMYLITGDRDMYQLTSDKIKIVSTHKGMSDISIMTPESVEKIYHGITPELVPDFYGLKGDSSDNIPGVPGIGPKRACELITTYGDLEGVIAHADEVKGKMGENLRAHIEDARISRQVAIIRTDAPVSVDLESLNFPSFDLNEVKDAMQGLGFRSLTSKVMNLGKLSTSTECVNNLKTLDAPKVVDAAKLSSWLESEDMLGVALDDQPAVGQLFCEEKLWVANALELVCLEDQLAIRDAVIALLKRGFFATLNLKGFMHYVFPSDSAEPIQMNVMDVDTSTIFDCSLAAYLLSSDKTPTGITELAEAYISDELPAMEGEVSEKAFEAYITLHLASILKDRLEEDNSMRCFREIEMPLVAVLCHMEREGMYVDTAVLKEQSVALGKMLEDLANGIFEEAGEEFNIGSPAQLSHVLFDVMEIPTQGLKKTRSGYYSTGGKVLDKLAEQYSIVSDIKRYRERTKIKSTYLDNLPRDIARDGRIHTTFNQTVAATGRLSSSDPNLQNIPVKTELGRAVRKAFSTPEGHVFLTCDYSQIELRLLAHLSEDEHLIKAFNEGADFHAATASRIFGVPVEEVTPLMRSNAKAVNFGIVYGQQAYGLSDTLGISRKEAQAMIDRYFEAYPGVRAYLDKTVEDAKKNLWVETMYGRKRHVQDIASTNFMSRGAAERNAMNHPMQGSAADIMKLAMIEVQKKLEEHKMKSKLILQIHDELDFEVPEDELEELCKLVKETMEDVVELKVPLIAEYSYAKTWADAK